MHWFQVDLKHCIKELEQDLDQLFAGMSKMTSLAQELKYKIAFNQKLEFQSQISEICGKNDAIVFAQKVTLENNYFGKLKKYMTK